MVIIWGSRMCGKVDIVPGICHVATSFGHLYYIPLIPTSSMLVLAEDSEGTYGVKVPLSFKSILLAWFRSALWVALVVAVVTALVTFGDPNDGAGWIPIVGAIGILVMLIVSYRASFLTRASIERATQFAEMEELPDEIREVLIATIKQMHLDRGDVSSVSDS